MLPLSLLAEEIEVTPFGGWQDMITIEHAIASIPFTLGFNKFRTAALKLLFGNKQID